MIQRLILRRHLITIRKVISHFIGRTWVSLPRCPKILLLPDKITDQTLGNIFTRNFIFGSLLTLVPINTRL